MNNRLNSIAKKNMDFLLVSLSFVVGGVLALLSLLQKMPLLFGVLGVVILTGAMFYYCLKYVTEKSYRQYYEDSYNIEHETIEEEIKKSVTYHRYQEAVLNRYDSACRDLGMSKEQTQWLLMLLMEEKKKADEDMRKNGIVI
ncbi:MAG: hypothetical protein MJY96_07530 [Bacteroidaceae bacterium]|nr:hypothetical protein [Candidatus Colenecus caballi]MCQ2072959.1 hypothetical protein [Bacteroidaceae bacterium]